MSVSDQPQVRESARQREHALRAANPFERLAPTSPDYARLPIEEGFNWSECLVDVDRGEWYLVVFRSVRRETADEALLTEIDDRAHLEAASSPGFLFYFKGCLNERRECLSFCLWERLHQARIGARQPMHVAATRVTSEMYESYRLERYMLAKVPGAQGLELHTLSQGIGDGGWGIGVRE